MYGQFRYGQNRYATAIQRVSRPIIYPGITVGYTQDAFGVPGTLAPIRSDLFGQGLAVGLYLDGFGEAAGTVSLDSAPDDGIGEPGGGLTLPLVRDAFGVPGVPGEGLARDGFGEGLTVALSSDSYGEPADTVLPDEDAFGGGLTVGLSKDTYGEPAIPPSRVQTKSQ